ncbi:MFS transporter [Streptomyces sp. A3M-1-3]|uniref:MFS transporter n=1 Tax=Streptomyces sp. A3M-1-3 TaxID=2962044 RepID=UPI0020B80F03|nr:MFS transporter [Streptomyces sp. A3M-1-3]MCP3821640.1 MFS transporter [Streptomyces sp. A3M-1-3]
MSTVNSSGETPTVQALPVEPAPERMTRRQTLVLVLLLGAQFTLAVDFSIMNVAVPVIGRELGFAQENLQWIATAFALSAAGFSLLFGRIADLVGARRIFLAGLGLLTLASLVGGLVDAQGPLLAARVAQGLATAMVTPAGLALLITSFPEGPLRDRALGLNGAMLSAGFTCGAIVGGMLTDVLSWRWGFFINVPIGVLLIVVSPMLLKKSQVRQGGKLDIPGAVTVSAGLIALVYGISAAGQYGWGDSTTLLSLGIGVLLLIAFGLVELRSPEPLAPLRILGRRTITWGNIGGAATFVGFTAMIFLLTLYLQEVLGYSPMVTGLTFGVLGVGAFLGGVTAPRWIGVLGSSHAVLAGGLLIQGISVGVLFFAGDDRGWLVPVLALAFLSSYSHVVAIVGFMVTATSGLPNEQQGLATGIATLTQQVSITVGIPIMSAVATAQIRAADGLSLEAATLHGINVAILVNGLIVVAVAVLVALFVKSRRAATAD